MQSFDLQESLIQVHEGVSFDENLVLIDKINPMVAPSIATATSTAALSPPGSEVILTERLASGLNLYDIDDLPSTSHDAVDPSEILLEDISDVVETSNVTETSSDKSISCNFLQEETNRRKIAENAVKVLSRILAQQTKFITEQTNELVQSKIGCDRAKTLNVELREENFLVQDQNETYESEMGDVRVAAQSYQLDCAKLKRQLRHENELIDQLKIQILEDRQEHQDDIAELRDRSIEHIELLEQNSVRLEKELTEEKARFLKMKEDYETLNTGGVAASQCKSDHHTQTQTSASDDGNSHSCNDNTQQEHLFKIEKLEAKLKEQTEAHEIIIDRLEKELRDEMENKISVSREYEKTIRDLESRVVNESTNASRIENDLAVAENRYKEANNDIKYFRQQFIETEQKLQVNQQQLSKALEENAILRQTLNNYNRYGTCGDTTEAMSIVSDNDDNKSTICESTCVSASTSVETFVPDRRRQAGDVTDYTDDESNSWYYQSNNTHHYHHQHNQHQMHVGFDSFPVPQAYQVNQDNDNNGNVAAVTDGYQPLPAGMIPIRRITDPDSKEQQISVVETRRPPPRKQRRKYGKPIDLTPSSSLTDIAFSDRSNNNNYSRDRQQLQQFNKNIAEIDRPSLEKQYAAIRQHRNSLIRENSFLKNKCHRLKQDLLFTEKNLQNFSLEAEHKIAMLLMALNNQEYVSTQDLNALLQMFPVPSSQQISYPQQYSQNPQQPQSLSQLHQHQQAMFLDPIQSSNNNNDNTAAAAADVNGFLSPYAPEYQPNAMTAAYHDMVVAGGDGSGGDQEMFIQPDLLSPMMHHFLDYHHMAVHHQQMEDTEGQTADNMMSVPSQLPETPVPQEVIDASHQLTAIGVPISKTL